MAEALHAYDGDNGATSDEDMANPIYYEEGEDEEDIISTDLGQSLLIQKSLLAPNAPRDDDWCASVLFTLVAHSMDIAV